MLTQETIEFLRNVPPFGYLADNELEALAKGISLEYYPKGVKILAQNGPPGQYLRIIKKGNVKVYVTSPEGEEETLIDYRSEGEQFGMISLMSGDRSRANVVSVEDTICYLIPKDQILDVLSKNPKANEYYLKSFFIGFIDKSYDETRRRATGIVSGERLLYTTPVGDIVKKSPVVTKEGTSIREAAMKMAAEKTSSVVVLNSADVPVGIVTDRDLREKVVARGRDLGEPVRMIMNSPLIKVDADEYCFEALLKMMHYKIHHILVIKGGKFIGIVTNHDFMVLQGSSPTVLVKQMEDIQSIEQMSDTIRKLTKTVQTLLREGAHAHNITGLITELAEKIMNRAADIVERKLGPAPLAHCIFVTGEAGRRELTLGMDVSMGVVLADTSNLTSVQNAETYFAEFDRMLKENLPFSGSAPGGGFINLKQIRTLADWLELFDKWATSPEIHTPAPEVFDLRPLRGDEDLVDTMRERLLKKTSKSEETMDLIATLAVTNRPPLGFFKRFVVEKSGEHKNELNIYEKGLRPLADAVRIFSLEKDITEIPTLNRLRELKDRYHFEHAGDVERTFEYLLAMLINHQLEQAEQETPADKFLNPENLSSLARKTLKESFQLIAVLYDIVEKSYRTERIG